MRWMHRIVLAVGAGLFVWLVTRVGLSALSTDAGHVGWGIAAIIAIEGIADLLHSAGWHKCFDYHYRLPYCRLWLRHLAGGAVNYLTPTATVGGELVRMGLLPRNIPTSEMAASVAANKLTATLADTLILLVGVALVLWTVPLSTASQAAILGSVALLSAGVLGFLWAQRSGRLAGLVGHHPMLGRLLGAERAGRVSQGAAEIDRRLALFHTSRPGQLVASTVLHAVGTSLGALQLLLFLHFLEAPATVGTVTVVFLVGKALDMATFYVPAKLGTQEGARMVAMSLVGLPSALGLVFSLVLRIEQIFWVGVGLVAYAGLLWRRPRA